MPTEEDSRSGREQKMMHIDDLPTMIDLGSAHTLRFLADPRGYVIGALFAHRAKKTVFWGRKVIPAGHACTATIWFDLPQTYRHMAAHPGAGIDPSWLVRSWNPIELEPALACCCSDYGSIIRGAWVDSVIA